MEIVAQKKLSKKSYLCCMTKNETLSSQKDIRTFVFLVEIHKIYRLTKNISIEKIHRKSSAEGREKIIRTYRT